MYVRTKYVAEFSFQSEATNGVGNDSGVNTTESSSILEGSETGTTDD